MARHDAPGLTPYLAHLRGLPFVRAVAVAAPPAGEPQADGALTLRTRRQTFRLALAVKRTFMDRALTNAVIANHAALAKRGLPLMLLARYIPRPTGERLAEAGVNFVDRPGNVHLRLGDDHHVLVLGRREPPTEATARRPGPALVQACFLLLAEPAAAAWPVRQIAVEAGIGKTAAATALQRLARLGVLAPDRKETRRLADRPRLADDFVRGYAEVLRPHLQIGRFRAPERDPEKLLRQFAELARTTRARWAITGARAAYALDRFYRGDDLAAFVDGFTPIMQRTLRLVPDQTGPLTLLRPFGNRWLWNDASGTPVVHPWLIYAELLDRGEPRALEAAQIVRERHLTP